MFDSVRSLAASFRYAGRGIWYGIRHERNFRIHLVASVYVLALALWVGLTREGWAALLLVISYVLSRELMNTAVEALVDLTTKQQHPLAAIAKDTAAGGVLIAAVISVVVGFALLWKPVRLLALWNLFLQLPWLFAALGLCGFLSVWFVFAFADKPEKRKEMES